MAEDPRSGFTEVQGIRLHYREWGDPAAPDLLLVHGWTSYSLGWTGVAEHFAGRYHVVAPDLRGHGESDKPRTGYRLCDFAEDVRQLIANLKLERPACAGHSWGGNIGTMLASDHPGDLSHAFLEDPVYWRMQHAFVTALPGAPARLERPEDEIRAEARERGLSPPGGLPQPPFLGPRADAAPDRQPGLDAGFRGAPEARPGADADPGGDSTARPSPGPFSPRSSAISGASLRRRSGSSAGKAWGT